MTHIKSPTWTRPGIDRWWEPNPLAMGVYCGSCGTRLERQPGQSTFYPCPFGCGDGEAS